MCTCECDFPSPSNVLTDISFADDCVFAIFAAARLLAEKTAAVFIIIYRVFSRFGLVLNCTPGKTEALLFFKGPGAHKAKVQHQQEHPEGIPFEAVDGEIQVASGSQGV